MKRRTNKNRRIRPALPSNPPLRNSSGLLVQDPTWARREVSEQLLMLTFFYDADPALFDVEFAEFQRIAREQSPSDALRFEHFAKPDGRQRFVLYVNGSQFDCWDFSAPVIGGFPGDDPESEPDWTSPGLRAFED